MTHSVEERATASLQPQRRHRIWRGFGRPFLSWIAAAYAAALAVVAGYGGYALVTETSLGSSAPNFLGIMALGFFWVATTIQVLTALPWLVLVVLLRLLPTRRGPADTVFGGLMGAALIQLYVPLPSFGAGLSLPDWALLTGLFFFAGMVGGLTYWALAVYRRQPN